MVIVQVYRMKKVWKEYAFFRFPLFHVEVKVDVECKEEDAVVFMKVSR